MRLECNQNVRECNWNVVIKQFGIQQESNQKAKEIATIWECNWNAIGMQLKAIESNWNVAGKQLGRLQLESN